MIFVTLGSQMFPFNRLINEINQIIKLGTNDEFYVQYGHT
ncbi:beta(1,3)galactosyltransferase EpsH, partial [Terribacillus saccharophilus]